MTTNSLVAVKRKGLNVCDLDKQAQRELVAQTNEMLAQVELARASLDAISRTLVYSEYLVSQALMESKAIEDSLAAAGIPEEEYLSFNRMLWHEYLQNMATVTHKAAEAISRQVE